MNHIPPQLPATALLLLTLPIVEDFLVQVVTGCIVKLFDTELFASWWLSLRHCAAQYSMLFVWSVDSSRMMIDTNVAVI
jgi:hypothetical protein